MRKKKSTQQLVGIESVTDSSVLTAGGELTFYLVQPTNLNVLPESGVRTRVTALLNVLKTSAEMELLALDAKESYQDNRLYYRRRAEEEGNPAIIPLSPPYNKDDSGLPPLPGILAEHIKQPPLNLTALLVLFLRGKNGGEIFDGNRTISENSRFHFTFIFDLRLHKIPPIR